MNERSDAGGPLTCADARRALRAWFDEGVALPSEAELHAGDCFACRRYREQLEGLVDTLSGLAVHSPSPDFVNRVREALPAAVEPIIAGRASLLLGAGVVVLGLSAFLGWRYPVDFSFEDTYAWVSSLLASLSMPGWDRSLQSVAGFMVRPWSVLAEDLPGFAGVSSAVLWSAMIGAILLLVAFNGFEARREQSHGILKRG